MGGIDARMYSRAKSEMPAEPSGTGVDASVAIPEQARTVDVTKVGAGEATQIGLQKQQAVSHTAPTRLEALGAAFSGSVLGNAYQTLTKPDFEPDGPDAPQAHDYLKQIPFQLNEAEYNALFTAKSAGERRWYADQFTRTREVNQVAGEYPLQNLAAQLALDPTMYVSGFAAVKATRMVQGRVAAEALATARAVGPVSANAAEAVSDAAINAALPATRIIAGAVSGAIEGAATLTAAQAQPMTNGEAALQIAASFAGGMMVPRGNKLVPADPDLPSAAMVDSLAKPHVRKVAEAVYAYVAGTPEAIKLAQGYNKFSAGMQSSLEGIPQKAGTPLDKLDSNFGDWKLPSYWRDQTGQRRTREAAEAEQAAKFREAMFNRADADLRMPQATHIEQLQNGEVHVDVGAVGEGSAVRLRYVVDGEVQASMKLLGGKVDSIAAKPGTSGAAAELLHYADTRKLANIAEVPDRSPGFLKLQKEQLSKSDRSFEYPTNKVKVKDAVWEEIPRPMREGASATVEETNQAITATVEKQVDSWGKSFGKTIAWNVHRTMASLSKAGEEVADLFVDNNAKYGINSVESVKMGIVKDMTPLQTAYEDAFRAELAQRGHGSLKQLASSLETRTASAKLEHEVALELMRREELIRAGRQLDYTGVNPKVKELADKHAVVMQRMLDEQKAAGVAGADAVLHNPGYFHRSYSAARIENILETIKATGATEKAARAQVYKLFQASLRKANPQMTDEVAHDVAMAIVGRTLRKGRMEDAPSNAMFGRGTAGEVRDMLQGSGLSKERLDRVIEVLMGKVDEQGKSAYMKHRVDLDYSANMTVGGKSISMADLIETNINTIMARYIDAGAAKAALARKGLVNPSDITKVREKYIAGATDRAKASKMFDDVMAHLEGRPTGEDMNETLRAAGAYSRMITLGASAIWQATEYSTMAARYGFLKTFKYAMAEMPVFKSLMETAAKDKLLSRELKDVITNQADLNIRLRPYIQKFEDNFEIPKDSRIHNVAQQGTQLVPYLNGMKLIHGHQARVHANLLVDLVRQAANGNAKAAAHLKGYGIESHIMDKLRDTVKVNGMNVDKWDDGVWDAVRPAFAKMTDESVLHARMGDMPAFALFTQTGKFIFQYRSFVLTAHNKVLAGNASRNGLSAVALMAMYQFPLAMMATQANEVASGREPLEMDKLVAKSIGQMGSLGLMTEVWNILAGNKREVGAPGLIPFDRTIKAVGSVGSGLFGEGTGGQAAKDTLALTPLLGVIPGWKMLGAYFADEEGK